MHRHLTFVAIAAVAATFATGCSGSAEANQDEIDSISAALEANDGAMTRNDEASAFGEKQIDETAPLADDGADEEDTIAKSRLANPRGRMYRVALIWGHMPPAAGAASAPEPTPADFSGSVSVDRGAIGVARTLRFDAKDHLEPRTSLREVSFVSHTLPHVDGMLVTVHIPEGASTLVHFKTAKVTTDIDVSTLETQVGGIARADDGYNGVSYLGFEDKVGCASGFLFGKWHRLKANLGKFHGRVVGDHGVTLGHIRGIYGHSKKADKDVFFGKYIDRSGDFRGLLGGGYSDEGFRGLWGTRDPRNAGGLTGFISDGYVADDGRGLFVGRFQEKCQ